MLLAHTICCNQSTLSASRAFPLKELFILQIVCKQLICFAKGKAGKIFTEKRGQACKDDRRAFDNAEEV